MMIKALAAACAVALAVAASPAQSATISAQKGDLRRYNFSDALKKLDIVWTPETVAKLFEIGLAEYTPGTKMPEQRIGSEADPQGAHGFWHGRRSSPGAMASRACSEQCNSPVPGG
jgi:cytochrome c2